MFLRSDVVVYSCPISKILVGDVRSQKNGENGVCKHGKRGKKFVRSKKKYGKIVRCQFFLEKVTKIGTKMTSNRTKLCPNSKNMKKSFSDLQKKEEKLSNFEKNYGKLSALTMSLAPPVHPSPIFLTDTENL